MFPFSIGAMKLTSFPYTLYLQKKKRSLILLRKRANECNRRERPVSLGTYLHVALTVFIISSPNFSAFAGFGIDPLFHFPSEFLKLEPLPKNKGS